MSSSAPAHKTPKLTVAQINTFLRQQPHLASQIVLPNHGQQTQAGEKGQILSLHAAKSQKSLRELLGLKKKQAEYIQTVAANETALNQVHTAALQALGCKTHQRLNQCIGKKWPETLGIAAGSLVKPAQIGFSHLAQKLEHKTPAIALFPLGELPHTSLESLFGAKTAKQLVGGSACAMGLHNTRSTLKAIILLADTNPESYYAGQDIQLANFLRQVAEKAMMGVT